MFRIEVKYPLQRLTRPRELTLSLTTNCVLNGSRYRLLHPLKNLQGSSQSRVSDGDNAEPAVLGLGNMVDMVCVVGLFVHGL